MNKVGKNLYYQTAYRILTTVTPLITAPYLARTLGAEMQGVYTFRLSIVSYFTLLAILGMTTYGTKRIAELSYDKMKRDRCFGELAFVQLSFSAFISLGYLVYCILFCSRDKLSWILLVYMVGYIFDFNWFFYGIQKFDITTCINAFCKILQVILIFAFVKKPEDILIYAVIMSLTSLLSFVLLVVPISHEVNYSHLRFPSLKKYIYHSKNSLILFIPIAAQTIYHVMDKTMLGAISSYEETGFYYAADKLVSIPIGIIAGVCTVMFPRMAELNSLGDHKKTLSTFKVVLQFLTWLSIALCFGIISVANVFVPFFYGELYYPCIGLVKSLSIVIILKSISEGMKTQYLIPNKYNECFIISVVVGAIINLVANFILIPRMGASGAVIGTLFAETSACAIQSLFVICKEKLWLDCFKLSGFFVIGFFMYEVLKFIDLSYMNDLLKNLILIVAGATLYISLSIIYCKITPKFELSIFLNKLFMSKHYNR